MSTIAWLMLVAAAFWLGSRFRREPAKSTSGPAARPFPQPQERPAAEADPLGHQKRLLEWVKRGGYRPKPVLHAKEAQLFREIDQRLRGGWKLKRNVRVLAQVSLGEILATDPRGMADWQDRQNFAAVNSKRVDLLLTCHHFQPRVVIEFQGWRHRDDDQTRLRDEAKHLALQKAGIILVEIGSGEGQDSYMPRVYRALQSAYPAAFGIEASQPERSAP